MDLEISGSTGPCKVVEVTQGGLDSEMNCRANDDCMSKFCFGNSPSYWQSPNIKLQFIGNVVSN